MRRKVANIIAAAIFLTGLVVFLYPIVSNQWNEYHQSRAIASYTEAVADLSEDDYDALWAAAEAYNSSIVTNTYTADSFSDQQENLEGTEYWSLLNLNDDGIMGYISILKIEVKLAIYHGTSDSVLQVGAGHMSGTSLPIGGEGTHSVIAAHRGLPSAELFTNLDQLEVGDKFYIHILGEVLAYEVDQILPMVDKDDTDALKEAMAIEEGEDYVTLFTCTPYGVNSHRLLVRGHRTEYYGEDDEEETTPVESMLQSVRDYYMLYLLGIFAAAILITLMIRIVRNRWISRKEREGSE